MAQTSSKRIREKAEALREFLGRNVSLRIDETKTSRKPPLHLHKRKGIVRACTANYVNLEVMPEEPRIVHTEWNTEDEETVPIFLHPGKALSIPLEDVKVAFDIDHDRLLVIITRMVWELSTQ